ncbi:2-dehydro-3-deoxygalactonokinase [Sphingobium sp. DC-2]|uniref:2-dehydro-3-deoxygalactonokinase n=1 Tax=Sphingobium sp. DC-2 TaxID=1303256 RepID=UPI0004C3845E|nr:2-dehydro-3-deoxygalactonokinase [Sphingobium sp. DC-2]
MSSYAVLGDWGTSNLRLFRVQHGRITAQAEGPGIGEAGHQAEPAFAGAIAPWLEDGMPAEIRLCGMAGARDGWVEAPYAQCPAGAAAWRATAASFDWRGVPVSIMAGLTCDGADGVPDVMRGEETQIFGACALHPDLARGRHLIVLPGTHNKWTLVEDGRVLAFRTVPTGELFALLRDRSTLAPRDAAGDAEQEEAGFADGLARAGEGRLLTGLFAARSMRLRANKSADWASGYLSGLLIGCEIAEIRATLFHGDNVTLIGDPRLSARYAQALEAQGVRSRLLDGEACALAGLGFTEN